MDAREYLLQIKKYDALMKHRKEEIERLRQRAMQPGHVVYGREKVQKTKCVNRVEDDIIDYTELEDKLRKDMLRYWQLRSEIIHTIEQLETVEYDFLYKVYVNGLNLQQVADVYGKSYSWATTTNGRAIKKVQSILNKG